MLGAKICGVHGRQVAGERCKVGYRHRSPTLGGGLVDIDKERWVSWVRESDVLLVNGGDTTYLCRWMQESGLADLFPSLRDTVYVGLSAGSMVLTPRIGEHFADGDDRTLGLVDFSIFPHLDSPDRTMAQAEQ